jgi:UDP-arabinose 4-epimerase
MTDRVTVLVTGGAGFIGRQACKALSAAGFRPVAYDNLSTGYRDNLADLIVGDVRDKAAMTAALRDTGAEAVMHFAASAYVGDSMRQPLDYYDNNVGGMISLLAACNDVGVRNIVFSSSCATYGIPNTLPLTEATQQSPISPYGHTKLMCEQILRDVGSAEGLSYTILRYFNAAGADPDGEFGERHSPETHLIPLALMAASGKAPPLKIFGTDYDTFDGTCIRDYIHVHDLARAHVLALYYLRNEGSSVALNLGSGKGHSIKDILTAINTIYGRPVPWIAAPRREGDPAALVADPSLAADVLGFRTARSDLTSILLDAGPWFGLQALTSNHV